MNIRIYTMTHKKFEVPPDPMYVPLQVGQAVHEDLGYTGDDTGDNISAKNCYYSELTGLYWVWKNVKDTDYVGVCHYRRYLINEKGKVFTKGELEQILQKVDVITTKRVQLRYPYYEGYKATHHIENLDATGEVIREMYPDYYPYFDRLVHGEETYFGNIMICSKKLYDAYADWLFSIFAEVEKRVDIDSYDDYHKRVFGFISEILLLVWVRANKLSVYECQVGMIGEKAETREMKEKLAGYFERKDVAGAKTYFMERLKKRPDVLMEASDITGELKLCMQVIATCERELGDRADHAVADGAESKTEKCVLDRGMSFAELMEYFRTLNAAVEAVRKNGDTKDVGSAFPWEQVSDTAVYVAVRVLCTKPGEAEETMRRIPKNMACHLPESSV
jgi:hypothetical protein